jgi:hypothetical protein
VHDVVPKPGSRDWRARPVARKGDTISSVLLVRVSAQRGASDMWHENKQRFQLYASLPDGAMTFRYISGLELDMHACRYVV